MRVGIVLVVLLLPLWPSLARAQQQATQSTGNLATLQPSATTATYPALYSPPFGAELPWATGPAPGRGLWTTASTLDSTTLRNPQRS
jgi:hypothetical protein